MTVNVGSDVDVSVGANVGISVAVGWLVGGCVGSGVSVGGMAVIVISSAAHAVAPKSGVGGTGVAVDVAVADCVGVKDGNHVGVLVKVGIGTLTGTNVEVAVDIT